MYSLEKRDRSLFWLGVRQSIHIFNGVAEVDRTLEIGQELAQS
jgi:hypothetical protein